MEGRILLPSVNNYGRALKFQSLALLRKAAKLQAGKADMYGVIVVSEVVLSQKENFHK